MYEIIYMQQKIFSNSLGVPDKYAVECMGHATNSMLKRGYQHTMRTEQDAVSDVADSCFRQERHTVLPTKLNGA